MFSTRIEHYSCLKNSMELASKRADGGEPEGLVLWADEILEAHGRHGRKWYAGPGGLWISLLLRPEILPAQAGFFNHIASLSMVRALEKWKIPLSIKWPNDLVWKEGNRKVCGVLASGKIQGEKVEYLLWGLGLNVENKLPDELHHHGVHPSQKVATTLKKEGFSLSVEEILREFLNHLEAAYCALEEKNYDFSEVRESFKKHCSTLGKKVRFYFSEEKYIDGRACGLDPKTGNILLETDSGIQSFSAGDCFHLQEE